MIRTLLVGLFVLSFAVPAPASPYRGAEHEAERWLIPCRLPPADMLTPDLSAQDVCVLNQMNFVFQYIMALSGSRDAMRLTASAFSTLSPRTPDDVGMPRHQGAACTWRLVALLFEKVPSWEQAFKRAAERDCGLLPPVEFARSRRHAEALLQRIETAPLNPPRASWEPDLRRFEHPPASP
ncbi:MAG: hypothetical protein M0002_03265 [Rhodospirillales bacterium]|nr:hypothetical protein [Rhodospirillales bacterium]